MDARGEAPRRTSVDRLGAGSSGCGSDIDRVFHDCVGHMHATGRGAQEFDIADGHDVTGERS